jgi:hypothetical protein
MKLVLNSNQKEMNVYPNVEMVVVKNQEIGSGFQKPMLLKID